MSDAVDPNRRAAAHDDLGFEMEHVGGAIKHDYATDSSGGIVPLTRRRGLLSIGALWLTMNCGFGEIFLGYEYHSDDFPLATALAVRFFGCALDLIYCGPAAFTASRIGHTTPLLDC